MSKSLPVAIADPEEYVAIFIAGNALLQSLPLIALPFLDLHAACPLLVIFGHLDLEHASPRFISRMSSSQLQRRCCRGHVRCRMHCRCPRCSI